MAEKFDQFTKRVLAEKAAKGEPITAGPSKHIQNFAEFLDERFPDDYREEIVPNEGDLSENKKADELEKEEKRNKELWEQDCIDQVKLLIYQDQTTTAENLAGKVQNYLENYARSNGDTSGRALELADRIVKELKDKYAE